MWNYAQWEKKKQATGNEILDMKSTNPSLLVQIESSLILKFQEMATQEQKVWDNLSWEISQNSKISIDFNGVGIEFWIFATFNLALLNFESSAQQECILSFGADCRWALGISRVYLRNLHNFARGKIQNYMSMITPWVSRNSCTRWVPGSSGPHPQILIADWSIAACVQDGSSSKCRMGSTW